MYRLQFLYVILLFLFLVADHRPLAVRISVFGEAFSFQRETARMEFKEFYSSCFSGKLSVLPGDVFSVMIRRKCASILYTM